MKLSPPPLSIKEDALLVKAAWFAIGLGCALRLWDLGAKAFWFDELGVAKAAFQPTLLQALQMANQHIMAMPLDYVITWGMAHISHAEGWLRLPEALWGCFTLLVWHQLAYDISSDRRIATLTVVLLAVSPVLVLYAQELRFYAPLIFFFSYAILLGSRAVTSLRPLYWSVFLAVTLLGIFFHLYTILAVGNVGLWTMTFLKQKQWGVRRNAFAISLLLLSGGFLFALLRFGGVYDTEQLSLFQYESFGMFISTGLGWSPPFPTTPSGWLFGITTLACALIGISLTLKKNPLSQAATLIYATGLQIILIVGFDYSRNYPLFARQIILLTPVMLFFSAHGLNWLCQQAEKYKLPLSQVQVTILVSLLIMLLAYPALKTYFQTPKGSAAEILPLLEKAWQVPQPIYMEPDIYEVFSYYWDYQPAFSTALISLAQTPTPQWQAGGMAWFIINEPRSHETETALRTAGFTLIYSPQTNILHPQSLWYRP